MNELQASASEHSAECVKLEEFREVRQELLQGASPEARAALQQQPSLVRHKSFAVDLAYGEFIARRAAGEAIDPDEFCARFPEYRSSLRHRFSDHTGFVVPIADEISQGDVDLLWPDAGEQFSEYTVLRELGRGTFARVYLATEASTGDRPVVLKVSLGDNAEARTLGRLAHDHIVPVLSARQHESGYFSIVCMPYLGSATLHDLLDRAYKNPESPPRHARIILDTVLAAPLPGDPDLELGDPPVYFTRGTWVDGVAHLGERLAMALSFVHSRGILHRDIKPSNILLDASTRPLLLDFNLSEDERLDGVRIGGTLPYMAPEQLRLFLNHDCGEPKPDGRADLFALAVILYELLTGQHPFGRIPLKKAHEETALLLLERQEAGCTPLRSLNPQVDRSLAALIESCLAFEIQDRPTSAAAFAAVLQRRFAPSRRARVLLCSVGALLLASSGVLAYSPIGAAHNSTQAPRSAEAAPRSAEAEYAAGCEAFEAGNYDEADKCFESALNASPKEERYLFARGRSRLALNDAGAAESKFADLLHLRPKDPNVLAALAYSELLKTRYLASYATACQAADKGFLLTPAFRTDRAEARLRTISAEEDFKAAKDDLNSVLANDPNYLPARYHRAMLEFDLWQLQRQKIGKENIAISDQAVADIEMVLASVKPGEFAELHVNAAHIYAATKKRAYLGEVKSQLRLAVLTGRMPKTRIDKDPVLPKAIGSYDFQVFYKSLPDKPDTSTPLPRELVTPNPIEGWLE